MPTKRVAVAAAVLLCACRGACPDGEIAPGRPAPMGASAGATSPPDARAPTTESAAWPEAVKTREQLLALGEFRPGPEWKQLTYRGMELAVAAETWPSDNESYISIYGYMHNVHFKEWRRFVAVQIRGAGAVDLRLDETTGVLAVVGAANNELKGKALFTFDLAAVSDDR